MKKIYLIIPLIVVFILATFPTGVAQENSDKNGLFPTDEGSSVAINMTLAHEGLVDSSPTLYVNKSYTLSVTIIVEELGPDVKDIHDISISTQITKNNFIGSVTYYHAGVFLDDNTTLIKGDVYQTDIEIIPLGPIEMVTNAKLSTIISVKENIELNVDPTTEFTGFTYDVILNPDDVYHPIATFEDKVTDKRSLVSILQEESQVNFTMEFGADSIAEATEKPVVFSEKPYSLTFSLEVLSLGPDVRNVHDVEIILLLKDTALSRSIPNSDQKYYFALSIASTDELVAGDKLTFNSMFYITSNVMDSEPELSVMVKAKESVPLVDPTTTLADFTIEMHMNPTKEITAPVEVPLNSIFIILPIALIVTLRRKLNYL